MKSSHSDNAFLPDILPTLFSGDISLGIRNLLEDRQASSLPATESFQSFVDQVKVDLENSISSEKVQYGASWSNSLLQNFTDVSPKSKRSKSEYANKIEEDFFNGQLGLNLNALEDLFSDEQSNPVFENPSLEITPSDQENTKIDYLNEDQTSKINPAGKDQTTPGDFKEERSPADPLAGRGLTAEYFNGTDFEELVLERIDSQVDFNWRTGSPDELVADNKFSVRWSGMVEPEFSETYTFSSISDDGMRLWVNGELLIDSWRNQSRKERSGEITLEAGQLYDIKMEYFEQGGLAVSQLSWESESQIKEVIPASAFYQKVDLQPQYFNVIQEPLEFGDSFDVEFQVKNVEVGTTADFDVEFYLSKDGNDFYLGSQRVSALTGNSQSDLASIELTLPDRDNAFWTGDGNYLLRMVVDGKEEIREINELNNSEQGLFVDSDEVQITDPYKVDLVASSFDVVQEPLAYGDTFEIQFAVDNTQKTDIGSFDVNFYVSRDNQIDNDDFLLGTYTVGSLAGYGSTGILSANFSLPDDADAFVGQDLFLFGMTIDESNTIEEINDENNANRGEFFDSDIVQISAPGQLSDIDLAEQLGQSSSEQYEFDQVDQPLIGIIDTGFAYNNPDFDYSRFTIARDYVDGDTSSLLAPGEGNEHGSHILGIIAATQNNSIGIDGLNDDAPVWLSRAIGSGQWATALTEFVDAALASGQPNAVVNLSLDLTQINPDGSETTRYELTPEERQALEYARQNGVLIVTAAGNDGGVMSVLGQASKEFDNIITVGAANGLTRAAYSNYGDGLDLLAEGGSESNPQVSTIGDGLGTMSGTSVAAAQVTGAASLVWAANTGLSYLQVKEILTETASDLNDPGWDEETGAGLLNLDEAVELAQNTTGVAYDPEALIIPTTWSGEGTAIPMERAVASYFPVNGKYYDWQTYYVQRGDTLSQIALDTLGGYTPDYYNWIADYNDISNPDLIYTYTTIQIPYEVAPPTTGGGGGTTPPPPTSGDDPFYEGIYQQYPWLGQPVGETIQQGNGFLKQEFENGYIIDNGSEIVVYQYGNGSAEGGLHSNPSSGNPLWGFVDPLKGAGRLSRDRHGDPGSRSYFAKDYGAPIGTPIYSMRSGVVTKVVEGYADYPPGGSGGSDRSNLVNYVTIELDDLDGFDDDYQAVYVHVQQNSVIVNVGDRVEAGQLIARTGHNGWSTGPHLHVEVNKRTGTSSFGTTKPFNIDNITGGTTGVPVATISKDTFAYTIVSGDTLSEIALRFLGDASRWREITDANGNTFTEEQARYLRIGQVVYLPGSDGSSQNPGGSNDLTSYTIQSGDTLWNLAEQYLGSGSRWREITKSDGSSFTEAEARSLQVGQVVYFPGGNNPTNPQPPTNPNPPNNPTDPQPPSNPEPPIIQDGQKLLDFHLNKTSLWGTGGNGAGFDWQGQFNIGDTKDLGPAYFDWTMKGSAGAFLSSGQAEIKLPGLFQYSYDENNKNFEVSANVGTGETLLSTYLGAGAGIDFEIGFNLKVDDDIWFVGGSGVSYKVGFEIDGVDILLGALSEAIGGAIGGPVGKELGKIFADTVDVDTALNIVDRYWESNSKYQLEGKDTAGIKFDVTNLIPNDWSFSGVKAKDFLSADIAVNAEQTSIFELEGFLFDPDNINNNGNEFSVLVDNGFFSTKLENIDSLRVQPIATLNTELVPKIEGSIGMNVQKAIDSLIPKNTPQWVKESLKINWSLQTDINLTIPNLEFPVDEFNPFSVSDYWIDFA